MYKTMAARDRTLAAFFISFFLLAYPTKEAIYQPEQASSYSPC